MSENVIVNISFFGILYSLWLSLEGKADYWLLLYNIHPDVLFKHIRDVDRAVGVLVLLDKRGKNSRCRKSGAVEGVHKLDPAVGASDTHLTAARLIIACVGDGADLLVAVHRRDLYLNVVGSCHGSRAVLRRQLDGAEVEAKALHKILRIRHKLVK